ncbi:hypothetical protein ID866_1859 [Astraeus odoratus]|nr:hypothetical protein ID866_1859 [Astraeus odoratus]
MRFTLAIRRRPTLLYLFILTFVVANAQTFDSHGQRFRLKHKRQGPSISSSDVVGPSTSTSLDDGSSVNSTPAAALATSAFDPTSSVSPTPVSSAVPSPSSSSSTLDFSSTPVTPTSSPASTPSAAASTQAATQPTTSATSHVTSTSGTNTAAQQVSVTSASTSFAAVATVPSTNSGSTGSGDSSGTTPSTSVSSSSSPDSSSGFFSNTGAVAGTFTIVGLVGLAGVIGVGMLIARRRRESRFEDSVEFLEKSYITQEPPSQPNHSIDHESTPTEMDHYGEPMAVTTPPAAYFSDHGHGAAYASQAQAYYDHQTYTPEQYGIAYPPAQEGLPNPHDYGQQYSNGGGQSALQSPDSQVPHLASADFLHVDRHLSIDSFYTGIVENTGPPGEAL